MKTIQSLLSLSLSCLAITLIINAGDNSTLPQHTERPQSPIQYEIYGAFQDDDDSKGFKTPHKGQSCTLEQLGMPRLPNLCSNKKERDAYFKIIEEEDEWNLQRNYPASLHYSHAQDIARQWLDEDDIEEFMENIYNTHINWVRLTKLWDDTPPKKDEFNTIIKNHLLFLLNQKPSERFTVESRKQILKAITPLDFLLTHDEIVEKSAYND